MAGYSFQPLPGVIKCEAKAERQLPFEKDHNGPKMFCVPHGHWEHKPVHDITRMGVHFQALRAGRDGERACHKDHVYPHREPIRSGTGSLLGITQFHAKFLNYRHH